MDPYTRRIYLSIVGILVILWLGIFVWAIERINPGVASSRGSSSTTELTDLNSSIRIPGFQFSGYRAVSGDTYAGLALRFHLLETTLRSVNQANDKTEPTTQGPIIVPSKDCIFHIVRPGQGLGDLARAYGVPLKEILRANIKRGDSDLKPGEILALPDASYLSRTDPQWINLDSLGVKVGFLKPTTGRFADGFGVRIHPITGKKTFHEGLDLAPGWRARVVASQSGRVQFAGIRAGFGRLIILDHGDSLTSWYAHLDEILVKPKQWTQRGDLIGKVGNSGRVTGPHLHFEVRLNGKPQNPFLYLVQ